MVIIQSAIEIIEKYENNCQNPNSTSTVVVFDVKKMHSNNNKTTRLTTMRSKPDYVEADLL